jgi:7-keto-8-aminopelargonate synthetase-like enzyme
MGVFSALRDELDWVLQGKLNHTSLIDADNLNSNKEGLFDFWVLGKRQIII